MFSVNLLPPMLSLSELSAETVMSIDMAGVGRLLWPACGEVSSLLDACEGVPIKASDSAVASVADLAYIMSDV